MTETSDDTAGRLTADALQLAILPDSITTFDWAERIGPAFQQGNEKLKELERRHESLILSRADEAALGWVLEAITARLIFLSRLNAEMCFQLIEEEKPAIVARASCRGEDCRRDQRVLREALWDSFRQSGRY